MRTQGWTMLRVLLNNFHQAVPEAILKSLPQETVRAVTSQEVGPGKPASAILQPEELIKKIHYSWIVTAIQKLPSMLHTALIAALPSAQANKVLTRLAASPPIGTTQALSKPVKNFLLEKIYSQIQRKTILPVPFLPKTSLTFFADLNKDQLVEIIDLLSMYDLAEEVRYIIDKKRIQTLFSCLSQKQRQFLHICVHQTDRVIATRLNLEQWDGDTNALQRTLHRRGLLRLGKALSGQHPDLIWHIAHTLDIKRGQLLTASFSPQASSNITSLLIQQITNLMNFLNTASRP